MFFMRFSMLIFCVGVFTTLISCSSRDSNIADEPPVRSIPTAEKVNIKTVSNEEAGEFITTKSGLKYRILRESSGRKPTAFDSVKAHYRGWLDDGTEFDSSYKRGEPSEFSLQRVVKGWTEGLQFIGEGGKIELEIPAELGYKAAGRPGIPGGATLHFVVELVEIQ